MQPTAQAVGKFVECARSPRGAKENLEVCCRYRVKQRAAEASPLDSTES